MPQGTSFHEYGGSIWVTTPDNMRHPLYPNTTTHTFTVSDFTLSLGLLVVLSLGLGGAAATAALACGLGPPLVPARTPTAER